MPWKRRTSRRRSLRLAAPVVAVGCLALLPAYGDTTPGSAVTHPEWARLVLRGLDLLEASGGVSATASAVFATLSGQDSRSWSAERYIRANRVEVASEGGLRVVRPTGLVGEAAYALAVARGGDYHLRLHVAGPAPAEAEVAYLGTDEILRSFVVPAEPTMGWIDAGSVHLDPGAYEAAVLLPEGATLEHVELAPPCLRPIEPPGGWQPTALATTEDVAVTLLQALGIEDQLPPAATPLEYRGSDLESEAGPEVITAAATSPLTEDTFRAGPRGARVVLLADIPEDGLYTLSVFGVSPGGQRWLADGCRKAIVCPSPSPTPQWRVILSGRFIKGPHFFEASVGPEAVIERIRFERKKAMPSDYVGTLARLGLELGPEGPIARDRAEEARRFLERRRQELQVELCGDILAPGTLVAELAAGAGPGGGAEGAGPGAGAGGPGQGGGEGGGEGGGTIPPPNIPPLPPASGVLPTAFSGD
jgi:hypothetical protein